MSKGVPCDFAVMRLDYQILLKSSPQFLLAGSAPASYTLFVVKDVDRLQQKMLVCINVYICEVGMPPSLLNIFV